MVLKVMRSLTLKPTDAEVASIANAVDDDGAF